MQAINYNIAKQVANIQVAKANISNDVLQKVGLFTAIISLVILAVNI